MKYFLLFSLLLPFALTAQTEIAQDALTIGEKITLFSKTLDEERTLNIYLPKGYNSDSTISYPVIYLLDGSMDEDFIHISGLVQFCSFSWINLIPESIVVGISNVDRKRDFTYPTTLAKDKEDFPTTGHSEAFIQFIEDELQPLIDSTYHTTEKKTLIGQSLGGLLATEILTTKSNLFDTYFIISPSLWWDDESLLDTDFNQSLADLTIYIAVGKEGKVMEKDAQKLYHKVKKEGNCTSFHFKYFKQHDHGDVLHQAVYHGLTVIHKH